MKKLRQELAKSRETESLSEERRSRITTEVTTLREERKQLKQELQEARTALLSSDKPDVVEMEQLRAKNQQLLEQVGNLKGKLKTLEEKLTWVEEAYQTASREGCDRGKEAHDLARMNEELQRKADERAVTLRRLQFDNQNKVQDQLIDKLKHQLAERDDRIRRLESERNSMGSYKGGRPLGTRATSVPRRGSPGTSRTSSPGPGVVPATATLPSFAGRDHPTRPTHVQSTVRRANRE